MATLLPILSTITQVAANISSNNLTTSCPWGTAISNGNQTISNLISNKTANVATSSGVNAANAVALGTMAAGITTIAANIGAAKLYSHFHNK